MKKQELKDKLEKISELDPNNLLRENYSLLKDLARNLTLAYIIAILLEFTGILSISQYLDKGLFLTTAISLNTLALTTYAEINEKQRITEAIFVTSVLLIIISGTALIGLMNSSYLQTSLILSGVISGLFLSS
jgi:FtsH-binding integral membrane protein